MKIRSIKQVKNLAGKTVLLRVDWNVAIEKGKVVDDFRMRRSLPTIQYLLKKKAGVILVSHLGRPHGQDKKYSLRPVQKHFETLLGATVALVPFSKIKSVAVGKGEVVVLENIRFSADEEKNSGTLAKDLAKLADLFVLDGFAVAHRPAASVSGVAKYLPSYAGLLLDEEITVLSNVMTKPKKPLVVILGGAKAETKIPMLKTLLPKADYVLVSGGIANTYWWAKGNKLSDSLVDKNFKSEVLKYCSSKKVILPVDAVVGTKDGKKVQVISTKQKVAVPAGTGIRDIGPDTIRLFASYMKKAKTLIWNGAMGVFEQHPYEYGTYAITLLFAARSKGQAFGVCGGGETVQVFQKMKVLHDVDLVSTGGGAMLEFLGGERLAGIEALKK